MSRNDIRSIHVQKLPSDIVVELYRVCRGVFYRSVYSGTYLHAKIYAPAFPAWCLCLLCGSSRLSGTSYYSCVAEMCVHRP